MTVLGKMLVFLVLVLSVVWNGLVVNAYVTRSNWKAVARANEDTAKKGAAAALGFQKLLEDERAAASEELRRLREEKDQFYTLYNAEKDKGAKALTDIQAELTKARSENTAQQAQQTLVASYLKQVDDLTKSVNALQDQNNNLVKQAEAAKTRQAQAEIEAAAQTRRADNLEQRVQDLQDRNAQGGGRPGAGVLGVKSAAAPEGFRGTVRAFDRNGDYVSFTPGLDAGLRNGTVLTVRRLQPAGKYVGRVTVVQVDPKEAVGRFTPPTGARLSPDDYPKPGDELVPDR